MLHCFHCLVKVIKKIFVAQNTNKNLHKKYFSALTIYFF